MPYDSIKTIESYIEENGILYMPPFFFSRKDAVYWYLSKKKYYPELLPSLRPPGRLMVDLYEDCYLSPAEGVPGIIFSENGECSSLDNQHVGWTRLWKNKENIASTQYRADAAKSATHISGLGLVFYDLNMNNYYHWWAECVPSLIYLIKMYETDKIFICRKRSLMTSFQIETFQCLGLSEKIFYAQENGSDMYHFDSAVRLKPTDITLVPSNFISDVRSLFPPPVCRSTKIKRKILLQRLNCRKIANIHELQSIFDEFNIEIVRTEGMSQSDQIRLFGSSAVVIGVHGAGLVNTMFCEPGSVVIELMPSAESRDFFWILSNHMSLEYGMIISKSLDDEFNSDVQICPVQLIKALKYAEFILYGDN